MNPFRWIIAGVGSALGIAIVVVLALVAFSIKNEVHDWRLQSAVADSVRAQNEISALQGRLALLDQNAARTRTVFVQARDQQARSPIVTGGGKHADSVANAAVNACYEKATAALTACEIARKTADSLPALKDSLNEATRKLQGLRSPPRWTAAGAVMYEWPDRTPMIRAETEFRLPIINTSAIAGADAIPFAPKDVRSKWRAYAGLSIPFH